MCPSDMQQLLSSIGSDTEMSDAQQPRSATAPTCFLQLQDGSDCILLVRPDAQLPAGCILLDDVQQFNLHIVAGDTHSFRLFQPPPGEPFDLVDLEGEVRLLSAMGCSATVQVDADVLVAVLLRQYFGRVVAANELLPVRVSDAELLVRVTAAHVLPGEEREEAIGYHCFRGRVGPTTNVYLTQRDPEPSNGSSSSNGDTAEGIAASLAPLSLSEGAARAAEPGAPSTSAPVLTLTNVRCQAARPAPTDVVNVYTRDAEWFPVKKKLLRPCIALTKVVRDSGSSAPNVNVDVDTLTFDRVLLFLEALHLGRPPPNWSLHLIEDMAKAATALGLRALDEYCQERLGRLSSGVRIFRFEEVVAANACGQVLLVLDSMVLDVTSWLPEHPGGSRIIPAQSLNCDCARFFEMYHASRESFLYLSSFYLGELHPEDRPRVPPGGGKGAEPPSPDFLQQLREYTDPFRLKLGGEVSTPGKTVRNL